MHTFNEAWFLPNVPGVQELTAITSHLPGKFEFVYAPKVQVQAGVLLVLTFELRRNEFPGTSWNFSCCFGCFSNVSSRNPLIDFCKNGFGRTLFG